MSGSDIPPCDPEVRSKGTVVAMLPPDRPAEEIERIIRDFRQLTGLKFDWHYVAGRAIVKWLEGPGKGV